jgi:hypothetical protein
MRSSWRRPATGQKADSSARIRMVQAGGKFM